MSEDYELEFYGKANDVIPLYKYKSKQTGLKVCIAQVEGPLVNGFFCLATEAHDDDGLPHTLEHLVFMGSEQYPFKGVLDLLANRCLASGTNAWTDTDHTCYTMTTAGSEGFLNLMPIYLDHVLYPTITDAAYITEVHHVNGEGEDAGVVYCEMQARENTGESRTYLSMLRAMYPGHCGYKSETGGMLENLRTSTSHKKVCDYHREFYRPENLCLIVTGMVKPEEVFEALKPFQEKILKKGSLPPYNRPWQSKVPPLDDSIEKVVKYASDDEKNGMVLVAWRGPNAKEQYTAMALMVLMEYLTDTSVAPLQRDFVEVEQPFCSRVKYSIIENLETCVYASFENVPVEKLKVIKEKLLTLLASIGSGGEDIDMTRMAHVIHRRVLESINHLEDQPHDTLAFLCIGDFLYGDSSEDLATRLNQIAGFKKMKEEPKSFWLQLINKYFVDQKTVTILGEPSKALMEEMGQTEKDRVKRQRDTLGDSGLKDKQNILTKATQDNEIEPPEEVLTSVPVPDVGKINFHNLKPSTNDDKSTANDNEKFPLADVPITLQLDDVQTNFVTMTVIMDTEKVPDNLKRYLPLYLEMILESPILRDGVLVSHEDVVTQLAADTVYSNSSMGVNGSRFTCGDLAQIASLEIKLEVEKYEKGVNWLKELLFHTQFTQERVKIISSKIINDVASKKRRGTTLVQTMMKDVLYSKESNHYICGMLRQHSFLTDLQGKLESQAQQIIDDLNKLRSILVKPENFIVHVTANVEILSKHCSPDSVWQNKFLPAETSGGRKRPEIKLSHEYLSDNNVIGNGVIAGVGSVESSFLIQTTPCLTSHKHADMAAILVYIQYLTQLEGPMWRQIRGLGLSYHYSMSVRPETGNMYFVLFKSTHIVNAYKQAKDIVDGYLSGTTPLTEVELEMAKSSLIFERIEQEKSPADASSQSLLSYFRGIDQSYNRTLIQEISNVTLDDLERIGTQYFAPLFDPVTSKVAICCHPTKVDEVVKHFKEIGRELTILPALEESFLSKW